MTANLFKKIHKGLVVSCQALDDEPLHSDFIMARMAVAAAQGGAVGIRANSAKDIAAIKQHVDLPIIGIIKRDYANSTVYITATLQEVDELMTVHPEMIALDATINPRPQGETLAELVTKIRSKYPDVALMADISTLEEAKIAEQLGFDCVSTTLHGYTEYTQTHKLYHNDYVFLKDVLANVNIPVIAEGNVETPEMAKRCIELGCYAVVVGSAITRPQLITQRFAQAIA
ncbi:MAG: N-acetylmannosamine-6-phosphate 2-epimerase [Plesiomonas sp.]